jgi:hypothetical protein
VDQAKKEFGVVFCRGAVESYPGFIGAGNLCRKHRCLSENDKSAFTKFHHRTLRLAISLRASCLFVEHPRSVADPQLEFLVNSQERLGARRYVEGLAGKRADLIEARREFMGNQSLILRCKNIGRSKNNDPPSFTQSTTASTSASLKADGVGSVHSVALRSFNAFEITRIFVPVNDRLLNFWPLPYIGLSIRGVNAVSAACCAFTMNEAVVLSIVNMDLLTKVMLQCTVMQHVWRYHQLIVVIAGLKSISR